MRGLASPLRDRVYALLLLFSVAVGAGLILTYLGGFEARADQSRRNTMKFLGLFPLAFSWAVICVAMLTMPEGAAIVLGPPLILLRRLAGWTDVPTLALWLALLVLTLLVFVLLQLRFTRLEAPLDRTRRRPNGDL